MFELNIGQATVYKGG